MTSKRKQSRIAMTVALLGLPAVRASSPKQDMGPIVEILLEAMPFWLLIITISRRGRGRGSFVRERAASAIYLMLPHVPLVLYTPRTPCTTT